MTPLEFQAIRQIIGYSVRELADYLGANPSSITRWSSEETPIPTRIETATNTLLQKFIAGMTVAASGKLPVATTAIEYEPLAEKISAQLGFPVPWFTYRALIGTGTLNKKQNPRNHTHQTQPPYKESNTLNAVSFNTGSS